MASAIVTVSEANSPGLMVHKVTFTWLSGSDGTAAATSVYAYTGKVIRVVNMPDGGATQPANLYDVRVADSDGADLLAGVGVDLSSAAVVQTVDPGKLGAVCQSRLALSVANAGDQKGGRTSIYIQRAY